MRGISDLHTGVWILYAGSGFDDAASANCRRANAIHSAADAIRRPKNAIERRKSAIRGRENAIRGTADAIVCMDTDTCNAAGAFCCSADAIGGRDLGLTAGLSDLHTGFWILYAWVFVSQRRGRDSLRRKRVSRPGKSDLESCGWDLQHCGCDHSPENQVRHCSRAIVLRITCSPRGASGS